MQPELLIGRILDDEGLTDGLNDPEARILVEWLVERVEAIATKADTEASAWKRVEALCRRARTIRRFVNLWCHRADPGAASQLVAAERLDWPLPSTTDTDPCEVLQPILAWEQTHSGN